MPTQAWMHVYTHVYVHVYAPVYVCMSLCLSMRSSSQRWRPQREDSLFVMYSDARLPRQEIVLKCILYMYVTVVVCTWPVHACVHMQAGGSAHHESGEPVLPADQHFCRPKLQQVVLAWWPPQQGLNILAGPSEPRCNTQKLAGSGPPVQAGCPNSSGPWHEAG